MKILGWMHHKFWLNSRDPLGEITNRPTFHRLTVRPLPDDCIRYFVPLVPDKDRQWTFQDPPEAAPLLHEGLLTIGTLGSPIISMAEEEQKAAVEEIAVKETKQATEKGLMLVSTELKKVLAVESEKAKCFGERISSASVGSGGNEAEACPLQGFLLGLPEEMEENALVAGQPRERRVSLGELFMRSRVEEMLVIGDNGGQRKAEGMNVMPMRMLTRRRSVRGNAGDGGGKCDATETSKFRKILRIFHRKIHPENTASSKKLLKPSKHEEKNMLYMTDNCSKKTIGNGNKIDAKQKEFKGDGISRFKCHSYPQSSKGFCRDNSNGSHEHWIKTDADYLVLEL